MLYVYYGEDITTARAKVRSTVSNMLAKNPDALYFRIAPDVLSSYDFDELTLSQGLFKSEYIIVLDTLLASKEGEERVLANLGKMQRSVHPFFILDAKILAPVRKKLEKHADALQEFAYAAKPASTAFNTFSLTDALAERDVKKLWVLFREAKQRGISDEEIHGVLFWMLKSISLAAQSKDAAEAGMKPYPFTKAKSALKHFGNLEDVNARLTIFALLPQRARRNGGVLEYELEKFILSAL